MSKFLTTPIWYDKNGSLIEMLTGNAIPAEGEATLTNLSIGKGSVAGDTNSTSNYGTAVGYSAEANNYSTVLGANASAKSGIAIGFGVNVTDGGIGIGGDATGGGIGIGGDATANQIRLGSPNSIYDLKIGTGNGVVDGYIRGGLYVPTSEEGFNAVTYDSDTYIQTPINGGIYIIRVQSPDRGTLCSLLFEFSAYNTTYSLPFNCYNAKDGTVQAFIKAKPHDNLGKAVLEVVDSVSNTANILHNFEISVRLISQKYGTS